MKMSLAHKLTLEVLENLYVKERRSVRQICEERARSQLGYDCLIVWDDELGDEMKIVERIKTFIGASQYILGDSREASYSTRVI